MSPSGPLYPTSASNFTVTGNNWVTPSDAEVSDGVFTVASLPSGGASSDYLYVSGFGFNIPSWAQILGIYVEVQREGVNAYTQFIGLLKAGSPLSGSSKSDSPITGPFWPASEAWIGYGGPTDAWNSSLGPSDINNSGFGVWLQAQNTHGGGSASVDAVRITVYFQATPAIIPKTKYYIYKVFDSLSGSYIGNLPNVTSDFQFSQDMNTPGVQITVHCGVSADTSALPVENLTDESGNLLTDEGSNQLTSEGQAPYSGVGTSGALIRNGNEVQVWEYSYYHVNGICMFSGTIENHAENFGGDTGDSDTVVLIYSDSFDLDDHLVRGNPYTYTLDQSQTSENTSGSVSSAGFGAAYNYWGQTFKIGAGVTNIAAIVVMLDGSADVTLTVYDGPGTLNVLGSVTQTVSETSPTAVQFNLPLHILVTAGSTLFFALSVPGGQSISVYYQNTNVYTPGSAYEAIYGGGSGGGYDAVTGDLYFQTYSGSGSTVATFTGVDPTSGMFGTIMGDYISEGGSIGIGNIEASGLTVSYGYNTNTVTDSISDTLTVSPNGYYCYVDVGADLLYLQQANTVADFVLTKGVHINQLKVVSTIEYVVNACYVVGALVGSTNVYTLDVDYASVALYGLRLQVHTDNNIPNTTTAHVVGSAIVDENSAEQYQTQVTIVDRTMDITLLVPGKVIGFNGFGTYVDTLVAQIVHRDYSSESVKLTLGILPKRESVLVEETVRSLTALSTITNPVSPS